jgi:hypothetical protein
VSSLVCEKALRWSISVTLREGSVRTRRPHHGRAQVRSPPRSRRTLWDLTQPLTLNLASTGRKW